MARKNKGSRAPDDEVEFELTLETTPDLIKNHYSSFVKIRGQTPAIWEHGTIYIGHGVTPRTDRFKLVRAGHQRNLDAVRQALGVENIPEGEWLVAFKEEFPQYDGFGYIGIADPSWLSEYNDECFPNLSKHPTFGWELAFSLADEEFDTDWRWLVKSSVEI